MIFYRKVEKKIEILFCSGDHSRPFWLSKINFLVSKTQNFKNIYQKTKIDQKIKFLCKHRFLDFKELEKTWKNRKKTWKNLKKPNKKSQDRKGTLAQARPPARPNHKITRVPFRSLGDLISTSEL